jgi:hypothetical protein
MKDLTHIKRFNESEENLNSEPRELGISDVIESKNQTYILVYMKETDAEMMIETLTSKQIKDRVKNLDYSDYAIIDGDVLKIFNSKSFDLNRL